MGLVEGQFCWYDLMTTDVDAAKAFYTETIGWSAEDSDARARPGSRLPGRRGPTASPAPWTPGARDR